GGETDDRPVEDPLEERRAVVDLAHDRVGLHTDALQVEEADVAPVDPRLALDRDAGRVGANEKERHPSTGTRRNEQTIGHMRVEDLDLLTVEPAAFCRALGARL